MYNDLVEFTEAINEGIEMQVLNINKALLLMETFFNYAIVDKQYTYDTSISYENTVFTFTVDLGEEDMIENPNQLRQNFQAFIEDVRAEMGNKYMQFSDLYVLEKDCNSITFALEMPSFENIDAFPVGPRCQVVMRDNDLSWLPYHIELEWGRMLEHASPVREYFIEKLIQESRIGFIYGLETFESSFMYPLYSSSPMYFHSVIDNYKIRNQVLPQVLQNLDSQRTSSSKLEIHRVELPLYSIAGIPEGFELRAGLRLHRIVFCEYDPNIIDHLLGQITYNN